MARALPYVASLAILIFSGVIHGRWTGRWSTSHVLADRASALGSVPRTIGEWEGRDEALSRRTLEVAEISGYVMRRYENRRDGRAVSMLLVCGRPGPISVHTPEVCYSGSGYDPTGPAIQRNLSFGSAHGLAEFWCLDLLKGGSVLPERLRVLYSWSIDGDWKATPNPRIAFAGEPALYKLYLVCRPNDEPDQSDSATEFARLLMPMLQESLSSAIKGTGGKPHQPAR